MEVCYHADYKLITLYESYNDDFLRKMIGTSRKFLHFEFLRLESVKEINKNEKTTRKIIN
jgi:hypothetical protein